jgi:hypothetical protein
MKSIIKPRTGVLAAMILTASAWRLIFSGDHTPMANFTPIGAMALFGGCYFSDKWKAYIVPLLTLWLTDLVLNSVYYHHFTPFYSGFYWVYGTFALMVMVGTFIKKVNFGNVILASIVAALLHYVITDFGTWIDGRMYPLTKEGFIACYVAAIPFLKNMLVANLAFGGAMFAAFEWAQKKFTVLAA